jgi:hypothetical protein
MSSTVPLEDEVTAQPRELSWTWRDPSAPAVTEAVAQLPS